MMFSRAWDQPRWEHLHISLSPGCLRLHPVSVRSGQMQLTTVLSLTWFIVLLIHCCIYCIHCWNYELLNQSKQTEWMKSSDIVALIIPIRFLASSFTPSLLPTSYCFSSWMSCGQWPSNDGQIITLHWICQVSCLFLLARTETAEMETKSKDKKKTKTFIINAKLCLWVFHSLSWYFPSPTLHYILHSPDCSSNLFRGYYGPLPSGKPITLSTKLYPWRYSFTFPLGCVCVCYHYNVTRTFTVVEGNAWSSISFCLPGCKIKTTSMSRWKVALSW